jgi:acetyl esterase/lipase
MRHADARMPAILATLAPWALLACGATFVALAINALRPLRHPWVVFQSFIAGLALREAALHQLAGQLIIVGALVWLGALTSWPGIVGIALAAVAWIGLLFLYFGARRDSGAMRLATASKSDRERTRYPGLHLLVPALAFLRRDIKVERGTEFCTIEGTCLRLDVFRPRTPGQRRPAIVQIHGGAWISGLKWLQGVPLLGHLAASGWVGFNVDYRLSPRAAFPAHLVDVKRAIAWVREHADEYGVDPSFVVVTGGSAGAHLAALVGLTADDARYQPGFEDADTSVAAVVALYGIYDLTERRRPLGRTFKRALERWVLKVPYGEREDAFVDASPIERVRADAPPFFVVHGTADSVAPIEGARAFVERLREATQAPVEYLEIPGAGHAFDIMPSHRTAAAVEAATDFLQGLHAGYVARTAVAVTSTEVPAQSG